MFLPIQRARSFSFSRRGRAKTIWRSLNAVRAAVSIEVEEEAQKPPTKIAKIAILEAVIGPGRGFQCTVSLRGLRGERLGRTDYECGEKGGPKKHCSGLTPRGRDDLANQMFPPLAYADPSG